MEKANSPLKFYYKAREYHQNLIDVCNQLKKKIILEYAEAIKNKNLWAARFYYASFLFYSVSNSSQERIDSLSKAKKLLKEALEEIKKNSNTKYKGLSMIERKDEELVRRIDDELQLKNLSVSVDLPPSNFDKILKTERILRELIHCVLKKEFGDDEKGWWCKGVPEKIRLSVQERREKDKERLDYFRYLYLIELKEIIEKQWKLFQPYFNNREFISSKLTKVNEIRNIIFHGKRDISDEEKQSINELEKFALEKC